MPETKHRYSDKAKEEVWTALKLVSRPMSAKEIIKEMLPEYSYSTISNITRILANEGYLVHIPSKVQTNRGKRDTVLYRPSGKDFLADLLRKKPARVRQTAVPTDATRNDNLDYMVQQVENCLQSINNFDEALDAIKDGLKSIKAVVLDLSKDFAKLIKVKDVLRGIDSMTKKNI